MAELGPIIGYDASGMPIRQLPGVDMATGMAIPAGGSPFLQGATAPPAQASTPEEAAYLARVNKANQNPYLPQAAQYAGPGAVTEKSIETPAAAAARQGGGPASGDDEPGVRGWLVKHGLVRPESEVNQFSAPLTGGKRPAGTENPPDLAPPVAGPPKPLPGAASAAQGAAPAAPAPPRVGGGGPAKPAGPSAGSRLLDTLDESDKRKQAAYGGVRDAAAGDAAASEDLAYGTQASHQEAIDRLGELQGMQEKHMKAAAESMKRTRAEIDASMAKLKPIDPEHWFASKSAGEKVTTAIGVALGAFATGLSKGATPNAALQIMQSAIDRDVDAQKTNIQKELSVLQKKHEFMRDDWARATWQSDQYDKLKIEGLEKARMRISGYAAQAKSADDKMKLSELDAGVVDRIEGLTQGMATRRYQFAQAQQGGGGSSLQAEYKKYALGQMAKGETPIPIEQFAATLAGRPGAGPARAGSGSDPLAALPAKDRERGYLLPDGSVALAKSKEEAVKARELVDAYSATKAGIAQAQQLRAKHGGGFVGVLNRSDKEATDQIAKDLSVPIARMQGVEGAVGEQEAERSRSRLGGDLTRWGSTPDEALSNADKWADQQFAAKIRQHGGQVAPSTAPGANPYGGRRPGQ